jgi:sarcosine oxidase subunit gamma
MADTPAGSAGDTSAPFRGIESAEWLHPVPRVARFVFRGAPEAGVTAVAASGLPLPHGIGRGATHGARAVLSLGPDEYLFLVPEDDARAFDAALAAALRDTPHSLVEVSHGRVAFDLRGPHAEWLLGAACPLPLDLEAFPVGSCTRTVFAKAAILLWRTEPDVFRVEVARSYGRYVADLLGEVARELPADAGKVS